MAELCQGKGDDAGGDTRTAARDDGTVEIDASFRQELAEFGGGFERPVRPQQPPKGQAPRARNMSRPQAWARSWLLF